MITTPVHSASRHSANPMAMSDGLSRGAARPAAALFSSFAQDFNHEHSGATRSASAKSAAARTTPRQDSPSPSCIYLG